MYKAKILANLKSHGYKWVNYFCAMQGLDSHDTGNSLRDLIRENKVEKQMVSLGADKFGRPVSAPLYRVTPNYGELVAETGKSHLSVVK